MHPGDYQGDMDAKLLQKNIQVIPRLSERYARQARKPSGGEQQMLSIIDVETICVAAR